MEVVDQPKSKKHLSNNQENHPVKCKRRYIQPPRAKPFVPPTNFCPANVPIDARTTYHSSYDTDDSSKARVKPILPCHNIGLADAKFTNDTVNKLSFTPPCGVQRTKAIIPRQRLCFKGPMEKVTTVQLSYQGHNAPKTEAIVPCSSIRTSKAAFEGKTTSLLSYVNPGPVEPVASFRPNLKYCPPTQDVAKETTSRLSYLPFEIGKKENYPWAMKPVYRPPDISMDGSTTYTNSYFENNCPRQGLIIPRDGCVFPNDDEVIKSTVYKESFLPCNVEPIGPIRPCHSILPSDQKMMTETTNKLSYQPVKGEKRRAIVPRSRKILGDHGFTANVTTNQMSYTPKIAKRTQLIVPCGHIRPADGQIAGTTTTSLSYINPGHVEQYPSFRPLLKYCPPEQKIDGETINRLSYQKWEVGPKEEYPWARKKCYMPPSDKIADNTIYHMSFPPPGQYIEEYEGQS